MSTWGQTLSEIQRQAQASGGAVDLDGMRSARLQAWNLYTGRSVISYAADMFDPNPGVQIQLGDMIGMMEVFKDLPGPELDLLLYTPGGEAEATDRLVRYLRTKFKHIRVFVPFAAMSAGTMWAMAADEIVMGKHSQLGPIDPQIRIPGKPVMPAGALLDQFREAQRECTIDPAKITSWLPTLQQYPPGLLSFCESAQKLSEQMVGEWLAKYMLKRSKNRVEKSEEIASWLADDKTHLSHSRAITRDQLRAHGIKVADLESDPTLQELVLSAHHAIIHTFSAGSAFKIIENHLGKRYVQHGGALLGPMPMAGPPPGHPGPVPGS